MPGTPLPGKFQLFAGLRGDELEAVPSYLSRRGLGRLAATLVVAEALYCGVCRPQEDPVELPQLK